MVFCYLAKGKAWDSLPINWSWSDFLTTTSTLIPFAYACGNGIQYDGGTVEETSLQQFSETLYGLPSIAMKKTCYPRDCT